MVRFKDWAEAVWSVNRCHGCFWVSVNNYFLNYFFVKAETGRTASGEQAATNLNSFLGILKRFFFLMSARFKPAVGEFIKNAKEGRAFAGTASDGTSLTAAAIGIDGVVPIKWC